MSSDGMKVFYLDGDMPPFSKELRWSKGKMYSGLLYPMLRGYLQDGEVRGEW
jgi:hypothetical protein